MGSRSGSGSGSGGGGGPVAERPAAPAGPGEAGGGVRRARPAAADGIAVQVQALQALCRQVFGFRLAVLALAGPVALLRVPHGPPAWVVGAAAVVTFTGSYLLFRDWERFGPVLLRHPALLAVDTFFAAALLAVATVHSPLAYVVVSTPLLAGLVYGWRGALLFTALQVLVLAAVVSLQTRQRASAADALLLPGFCLIAGAVGISLRRLMLRFGAATSALAEARARLAATEAVAAERARLAREMHDSVAKTLHGVALAADGLAAGAERLDSQEVRRCADLVARAARRAAAESRELLGELRGQGTAADDPASCGAPAGVRLADELAAHCAAFQGRTGLRTEFCFAAQAPLPPVPAAVARQLVRIVLEALENVHRHAGAESARVELSVADRLVRLGVADDGCGLPAGISLDALPGEGRFGLVGMAERAAAIGARLGVGGGPAGRGTHVRLELPVAALGHPARPAEAEAPPDAPLRGRA